MRKKLPIPTKIYDSRIESLRKECKWTQKQVASRVECDLKTLRSWERGFTYPDTKHLLKLSEVFHVSTDYLLGLSLYRNIGNEEIISLTGLSEDSIEVLRFLCKESKFDDDAREHRKTIDFINRVFKDVHTPILQYRDAPGNHGPLTTIFSIMMQYVDMKDVSLSFIENNKRHELSGSVEFVTLDFDENPIAYTVAELSRVVLVERIKKILDSMRTKKEE